MDPSGAVGGGGGGVAVKGGRGVLVNPSNPDPV